MSSRSLLSSLFDDNSGMNRSSSLMMKTFLTQTQDKARTRSQSINHQHPNNKQGQANTKYLPLLRMGHIIATKVKKHNYFFFCRLESNLKKINLPSKQKETVQANTKQKFIEEGLNKLKQFTALHSSKQNLSSEFRRIKNFSIAKKKVQMLSNAVGICMKEKKKYAFQMLKENEKVSLKMQIFVEVLSNKMNLVKFAALKNIFLKAKSYNKLRPISQESSYSEEEVKTPEKKREKVIVQQKSKDKYDVSTFKKKSRKEESKSNKKTISKEFFCDFEEKQSEESEQLNDVVHLKKQIRIQAPRPKISMGRLLNLVTKLCEEDQIIEYKALQYADKKMGKQNHLYSQNLKEEIPDLHDNTGVFAEKYENQILNNYTFMTEEFQKIKSEKNFFNHTQDDFRPTISKNHKKIIQYNEVFERSIDKFESKKSQVLQMRKKSESGYFPKKNFVDPSALKIEDMLREIEKIRQRQKAKPSPNVQQYKFSVVFPKKSIGKSVQNSAAKSTNKDIQFQSDKKEMKSKSKTYKKKQFDKENRHYDFDKRKKVKTPNKAQKYETQVKKKKEYNEFSTIDPSSAATARRMKKYESRIDNYLNHIKSRGSLSNLKINRNQN